MISAILVVFSACLAQPASVDALPREEVLALKKQSEKELAAMDETISQYAEYLRAKKVLTIWEKRIDATALFFLGEQTYAVRHVMILAMDGSHRLGLAAFGLSERLFISLKINHFASDDFEKMGVILRPGSGGLGLNLVGTFRLLHDHPGVLARKDRQKFSELFLEKQLFAEKSFLASLYDRATNLARQPRVSRPLLSAFDQESQSAIE